MNENINGNNELENNEAMKQPESRLDRRADILEQSEELIENVQEPEDQTSEVNDAEPEIEATAGDDEAVELVGEDDEIVEETADDAVEEAEETAGDVTEETEEPASESESGEEAEAVSEPDEKAPKKKLSKSKMIVTIVAAVVVVATLTVCTIMFFIPMFHYHKGDGFFDDEKYDSAADEFDKAGDFRDAEDRRIESIYQSGIQAFDNADYEKAIDMFSEVSDYQDSEIRGAIAEQAYHYSLGESLYNDGAYLEAVEEFKISNSYEDADDMILTCYYDYAVECQDAGDYSDAVEYYGLSRDAGTDTSDRLYNCGIGLVEGEKFEEAVKVLSGYDPEEYDQTYLYYAMGRVAEEKEDYAAASEDFSSCLEYADANDRFLDTTYKAGQAYSAAEDYLAALDCWEQIPDYLDTQSLITQANYQAGIQFLDEENYTKAKIYFTKAGEYEDSAEKLMDCNLMIAYETYCEGSLSSSQCDYIIDHLEEIPDDFTYKTINAGELRERTNYRLNTIIPMLENAGFGVTGNAYFSCQSGYIKTEEILTYSSSWWENSSVTATTLKFEARIKNDNSVSVTVTTSYWHFTNYSSIRDWLEKKQRNISYSFTITNGSFPTRIEIDDHTTLTRSNGTWTLQEIVEDTPYSYGRERYTARYTFS